MAYSEDNDWLDTYNPFETPPERKSGDINFGDELNEGVPDVFDHIAIKIVEKYKDQPDKLAKIVNGIGAAHTHHSQMKGKHQKSIDKVFEEEGLGDLFGLISTSQGDFNSQMRKSGYVQTRTGLSFHTDDGGQKIQFLLTALGRALRNREK